MWLAALRESLGLIGWSIPSSWVQWLEGVVGSLERILGAAREPTVTSSLHISTENLEGSSWPRLAGWSYPAGDCGFRIGGWQPWADPPDWAGSSRGWLPTKRWTASWARDGGSSDAAGGNWAPCEPAVVMNWCCWWSREVDATVDGEVDGWAATWKSINWLHPSQSSWL